MNKFAAILGLTLLPSVALAGALGGPVSHRDTVAPGERQMYTLAFEKGELAVITVRGDDSSDFDCYIYTSDGAFVTKDDDSSDDCFMSWTPQWRGKFQIVVKNRGSRYNEYVLQTN